MRSETTSSEQPPPKSVSTCDILRNFAWLLFGLISFHSQIAADEFVGKSGKALEKAMSARVSWSSVRAPLGEQLRDFQKQSEVTILRDRRTDPQQPLDLEASAVPRVQILRSMAKSIPNGAFCLTEQFAYLGPAAATYRLPVLLKHNASQVNELRKQVDTATFRKLTQKINASWTILAEPRQILMDYSTAAGVTITNPNLVPHDVWGAAVLPKMQFVDCATMLLNQFDLTLKVSPQKPEFTLVPVDPSEVIEHRYEIESSLKTAIADAWTEPAADMDLKWNGNNAIVVTTLAEHIRLNSILAELRYAGTKAASSEKSSASLRTTQFQLKAERATVGQLIEYFRSNKIRIDVKEETSEQTKSILTEIVQLNNIGDKKAGTDFFPQVFGGHFKQVTVLDDRVILSQE